MHELIAAPYLDHRILVRPGSPRAARLLFTGTRNCAPRRAGCFQGAGAQPLHAAATQRIPKDAEPIAASMSLRWRPAAFARERS